MLLQGQGTKIDRLARTRTNHENLGCRHMSVEPGFSIIGTISKQIMRRTNRIDLQQHRRLSYEPYMNPGAAHWEAVLSMGLAYWSSCWPCRWTVPWASQLVRNDSADWSPD